MKILVLAQYYVPEEVGIGVQLHQLTTDLVKRGHEVTMLTGFPNYPSGVVQDPYKGKKFQVETIDGVRVIRTWLYATPSKRISRRLLNFGSFCTSAFIGGLLKAKKLDAIYAVLPPLPLGLTATWLGKLKGAKVVTNIQDIYPHAAVALGVMSNPRLIRFFERMEKKIYRRSAHLAVISEGFRENMLQKGVPPSKVSIVPNWIDTEEIKPGPKCNDFREELGVCQEFLTVYSGSLSLNSNLEPVLHAAKLLKGQPFKFAIVGQGVHKEKLEGLARDLELDNLVFKPFQPLERYPLVLNAADLNVVTLNTQASLVSVPSKVYKQMAAGRPVLAVAAAGNELDRLVKEAGCGFSVQPDDPEALAQVLQHASENPEELEQMGRSARAYVEKHHTRQGGVDQIEAILKQVAGK